MSDNESSGPDIVASLPVLGISVLAFLAGSFVTEFESFPYPQLLEDAYTALRAGQERADIEGLPTSKINFWGEPWSAKRGVTIHDPQRAWEGYTLYSSGHVHGAFLIDMQGEVVHRWEAKFSDVFPEPPHVDDPASDRLIYWRRVAMFPNGDVVAQFYAWGDTPYGYGLVKVDKDSNVLWKLAENVHHDFEIAPDGTIWTLGHGWRDTTAEPVKDNPQLEEKILEDTLMQVSADGEKLREISVTDAMVNGGFTHAYSLSNRQRETDAKWDPLHVNDVAIASPQFAAHHDWVEPGQLVISLRSIDTIAVVDPDTETMTWADRGFWTHQHDPDPLPNGRVMIFDNRGHGGAGGKSRVIEFDPQTNAMTWMYTGTDDHPFDSYIRSNQVQLPNGNLLVSEHKRGRLFEVTRDKEIVWEYHNPHRIEEGGEEFVPAVSSVQRYAPDYPQFPLSSKRE